MKRVEVVHAILKRNDKFLLGKRSLIKRSGAGYWATIGGCVETDESLEDGLKRECAEEIGIEIKPLHKIATVEEQEAIHYWFEVEIIRGEPFLACDENSELKWLTLSEIKNLSPITPDDLQIILTKYESRGLCDYMSPE